MRIEPPDNSVNQKKKSGKTKRKSLHGSGSGQTIEEQWAGFVDLLGEVQLEKAEEEAKKFLQMVLSSGNRFSRSPSHKNFQSYRESIRHFLQFVEKGLYRIREDMGLDAEFPKLYMVAEVVDEKMHQIANLLMSNEKNTLNFAGKVEEINGLLLDLYR
ncbi:MAG TPA: YaaR family protein [Thermotogota bacterium]|nr:YaaR family protein [Thermotogota bacterium]HRW92956.1 YaaR family protein [Thermotogota bacterium]